MSKNHLNDNRQKNDPWKKNKNNQKNKKNKIKKIYGFFNKLDDKFNIFKKKKNYKKNINLDIKFIGLFLVIISLIWIGSGFYTIKESDRGIILRFGKYNRTVHPGLNWKPTFIEKVIPVNVETIREQITNGMMLTSDENVIQVEMNVQYRISHPDQYLFNIVNPDNTLREATDSAVRGIIGQSVMEQVLTKKRKFIRDETQKELEQIINSYKMGITILDVNFQSARPPDAVKSSFDDVIAAREEEEKTIREAQAYRNEVLPLAKGNAQKLIEEATAYKSSVVFKAEGEIASFIKILPQYHFSPKITKERLYIETMEKILSNTRKIIINDKNNNILVLPLEDKYLKKIKNETLDFKKKTNSKIISSNNISKKLFNTYDTRKNNKARGNNSIQIGRQ